MGVLVQRLPNLNQLRAFEAAVRHGSFTKAAEELHVSQTAISHSIRALEDELGEPLFLRRTRKVFPTDRAEVLAEAVGKALSLIADATAAFGPGALEGTLRISVAPFFGNRVLLPLLSKFHDEHPSLKISASMATEVVDLMASELDGGLRYGTGHWPGLRAIPIMTDMLQPCAAPQVVGERSVPLSPEVIAELSLSAPGDSMDLWMEWFQAAGAGHVRPREVIDYTNRAASTDMALSGFGAALCERRLVAQDIATGRLVPLHPVTIKAPKSMYLVHPERGAADPRMDYFARWLAETLDLLPEAEG